MFKTPVTTNEQLQHCVDYQSDVVIWLFGKCDGTAKITNFNKESVKADNGFWYVREHCKLYV